MQKLFKVLLQGMVEQPQQFKPENVQWVDLSGESPQPKKSRNIPWTRLLVFITIVIGGLILIILFIRAILPASDKAENQQMLNEIAEAEAGCQEAEDVEKCLLNVRLTLSKVNGNGDYCEDLKGSEYDSCIMLAALSSEDRDLCDLVQNEEQGNDCKDAVHSLVLNPPHLYSECDEFIDAELKSECEWAWLSRVIIREDCLSFIGEDFKHLCDAGIQLLEAVEKQDPDLCENIEEEYYLEVCYEDVGPGDRDFDGLDSSEEDYYSTDDTNPDFDGDGISDGDEAHIYKTNPANADTDGDGYNDKVEIDAGFDPLT